MKQTVLYNAFVCFVYRKKHEGFVMKFIPLVNLKNTTGIVTTCKEEKEPIVANKNGVPALVLMSRVVYVTHSVFGK